MEAARAAAAAAGTTDETMAYALAIVPALHYCAKDVCRVLKRLVREYGYPANLRSD